MKPESRNRRRRAASSQHPGSAAAPASLVRRLASATYDAVLLLAIWFFATALVLPLTGGEAIPAGTLWFPLYLVAWAALFFCGFWVSGGQTLGMRAWHIRVVTGSGDPPGLGPAVLRFVVAIASWTCLGAGFWWALLRRDRCTWHDLASGTRLVRTR